ncbi:MAG: hypothetical protein E7463_03765 [Ruminococcaceae bacterium]|nr:hypothetical protein [Oscillospiraceae bacterium]
MIADSRTFAFDYSKTPLPEEAFRNIADVGVRYRRGLTHLDIHGTWDTNISSEGIVYIAHACEGTKEDQTSLIAYNWMEDRGYVCYDTQKYTLAKPRALPHTKLHESITELPDGRIAATTHSTSKGKDHPEWMPFAHMHHTWEGYPGSYILVYDPKTGEVENWGIPVPRESIYGMTYDAKYNCLYMIGFMRGHVYRFSIDDRTVKDLGKAAEVFCYRLHAGPDGHIYGMTKSGYLWRVNVDTAELEDLNWRHPAAYDNSWTNTWYRYMAKARNISDHEFVFHSYTSDEFYCFDTNTQKAYSIGKKFTHDDHNNVRHTEFCLNEFVVDKYGALWYQIMPVVLGNGAPTDYRKYTIPSYLMYWDIRNNRKPVNLGVISNNDFFLSYSTGVCYDEKRDILHLVGNMCKMNESGHLLGITSIELEKFRPAMMEKGAICKQQSFRAVKMNDEEIAKVKEATKRPFPKYSGEEVPAGNNFQAFPIDRVTPIRLWRAVPHTDIPASKVIGIAWDDQGVLHGLCGDGEPQYYFTVKENLFEILGRTLEEVDENPTTWLYKGVFGKNFKVDMIDGLYGVKPPKAFAYKLDKFIPYSEMCDERKAWLEENILPGKQAELPEGTKLPEVAGRRYLSDATYVVDWHDGLKIAGTKDGLLGIVRPDGSVYNLGNCAPYGPVRCMTTNADKTELFGVAGDEEDMGMVFHYDDMRGISQVGHLNYNSPNHMDGPSSANVLSCIAVSKDGKNVAIGNIDRMGCIHIADLAAMRIE